MAHFSQFDIWLLTPDLGLRSITCSKCELTGDKGQVCSVCQENFVADGLSSSMPFGSLDLRVDIRRTCAVDTFLLQFSENVTSSGPRAPHQ